MQPLLGQYTRPPISLRTFLTDYKAVANELPIDFSENEELLIRLDEKCSLDKLNCEDDAIICDYMPDFPKHTRKVTNVLPYNALKLETIELLKKHKERSIKNPFSRTRDIFKHVSAESANTLHNLDFNNELLVWVRIYRPARVTHIGRSFEKPVFAEEFVCLGENYLSELRDKISCVCNGKRFFDISNDVDQEIVSKDTDPGFFFITDTFYNDTRNKNNVDYSEHVRTWAEKAEMQTDIQLKVAEMQNTKFIDLNVSLGAPQLYQHHGNCEHILSISQVELLTQSIKHFARADYPRCMTINSYNDRPCQMCGRFQYVFVVEESDRQLHDPAYLCEKCFRAYHYVDGKKIGNFKAYRLKNVSTQLNTTQNELESEDEANSNDSVQNELSVGSEEFIIEFLNDELM